MWEKESEDLLLSLIEKKSSTALVARDVAREMEKITGKSFTRNSIIGKLNRMGVSFAGIKKGGSNARAEKVKIKKAIKNSMKRKKAVASGAVKKKEAVFEERVPTNMKCTMEELKSNQCRYCLDNFDRGKAGEAMFCGRLAIGAYCEEHNKIARVKTRKGRKDLEKEVYSILS